MRVMLLFCSKLRLCLAQIACATHTKQSHTLFPGNRSSFLHPTLCPSLSCLGEIWQQPAREQIPVSTCIRSSTWGKASRWKWLALRVGCCPSRFSVRRACGGWIASSKFCSDWSSIASAGFDHLKWVSDYSRIIYFSWPCHFAVLYLLWAFIPDRMLRALGFHYYPDRYLAVAIPAWIIVTFLCFGLFVVSLNLLQTAEPESYSSLVGEHYIPGFSVVSRVFRVETAAMYCGPSRRFSRFACLSADTASNDLPDKTDWASATVKGTPEIGDYPITLVTRQLYPVRQTHPDNAAPPGRVTLGIQCSLAATRGSPGPSAVRADDNLPGASSAAFEAEPRGVQSRRATPAAIIGDESRDDDSPEDFDGNAGEWATPPESVGPAMSLGAESITGFAGPLPIDT